MRWIKAAAKLIVGFSSAWVAFILCFQILSYMENFDVVKVLLCSVSTLVMCGVMMVCFSERESEE